MTSGAGDWTKGQGVVGASAPVLATAQAGFAAGGTRSRGSTDSFAGTGTGLLVIMLPAEGAPCIVYTSSCALPGPDPDQPPPRPQPPFRHLRHAVHHTSPRCCRWQGVPLGIRACLCRAYGCNLSKGGLLAACACAVTGAGPSCGSRRGAQKKGYVCGRRLFGFARLQGWH